MTNRRRHQPESGWTALWEHGVKDWLGREHARWLPPDDEATIDALRALLKNYETDTSIVADLEQLRADSFHPDRIGCYRIARKYGLRAPWAGYMILRSLLIDKVERLYDFREEDIGGFEPETEIPTTGEKFFPMSDERREDYRRRYSAYGRRIEDTVYGKRPTGRPRETEQHSRWLFLRTQGKRWAEIARESGYIKGGATTVKNAVEHVAKGLEVTLPQIPSGRPRRSAPPS